MKKRSIKTAAGLRRAWEAIRRRSARFYERPYIVQPALAKHLDRFEKLKAIDDEGARFQAFRLIPSLEFELEAVDAILTPAERKSLAQGDRARHPRVRLTEDGRTLEGIIHEVLSRVEDPWRQKAKQYWLPLIYCLQQRGLKPSLFSYPDHPSNEKLEYDFGGGRRSLTLRQFENIVSRVRRRLSNKLN
jgi:hypothetical protein